MKTNFPPKKQNGIALISILFIMALLVMLVTAITMLSRSELRSSDTYQNQVSADSLAHAATNLVISQVRNATGQAGEAWASQPGAIRKYDTKGKFLAGYKLYSDDDMIITTENEFFDDKPPIDWDTSDTHYVDLNEPATTDSITTFPILDPRAEGTVEGFSYTEDINGTVKATDDTARLPMPTRWLYILEDGTTGHLDPQTNEFTATRPNGEKVEPSKTNQIVGRVAFWSDDESSKININTASEPTFWDTPKSVSLEDLWYARAQPAQREYQRYPGHPATTALSTVLFGGEVERKTLAQLDGGEMKKQKSVSGAMKKNRDIKEKIYDIVPRVNVGGSESGTIVNKRDDSGIDKDNDHLYSSIDEFIFKVPRLQTGDLGKRSDSDVVTKELLEQSRFFLTAHSRAPELNLFGLPRVSIWPTADEKKEHRHLTAFDKLIRFCSTSPAGHRYFFTRMNADSPTDDWTKIKRNRTVYEYLKQLTSKEIPGVGGQFDEKYQADHTQILTEIFDYIRITNLCDDSHPKLYYTGKEQAEHTQFTNPRRADVRRGVEVENHYGTHGGHGQVAPIKIGNTQGFGRFVTASEFGLIFICSASPEINTDDPPLPVLNGRVEDAIPNKRGTSEDITIHYSNYPPLIPLPTESNVRSLAKGYEPFEKVLDEGRWPANPTKREERSGPHRPKIIQYSNRNNAPNPEAEDWLAHPAYDPFNWNHALKPWKNWVWTEKDKRDGVPMPENPALKPSEIVIQAAFVPEAFVAAQGWSALNSRMRIEVTGLGGLKIEGNRLEFGDEVAQNKYGNMGRGYHGRAWGGGAGFRGMMGTSHVNNSQRDYNFVSEPLRFNIPSSGTMFLSQDREIEVKIYAEATDETEQLIQTIKLDFPSATLPLPKLHKNNYRRTLPPESPENNTNHWLSVEDDVRSNDYLGKFGGTFSRGGSRDTSCRFWWSFNNVKIQTSNPSRNLEWRGWGNANVYGRKNDNKDYAGAEGESVINGNDNETKKGLPNYNSAVPFENPNHRLYPLVGAYFYSGRLSGKESNPGSPWTKENNNSEDTKTRDPGWRQGPHRGAVWREGDIVRSLVPVHGRGEDAIGGDYRLIAMNPRIESDTFIPHVQYFKRNDPEDRIDHTLWLPAGSHYYVRFGNADLHNEANGLYPEFNYSVPTQLTDASYHFSKFPDYPRGFAESPLKRRLSKPINTGDFDNGVALTPDGAYINKPDGGNRSEKWGVSKAFTDTPTPYFDNNWSQGVQGPAYFSPNRQISSPVMFGSLPTGVKRDKPWQTLLFRPQSWGHPEDIDDPHPGFEDPRDHYLLDLFWMPVVEPYAISEPFSTAGKINLNYQILPFTNIKRATGLHAVMKAEEMLIVSDAEAAHYKNWDHALSNYYEPPLPEGVHLRQMIDVDETLKQFDDRFINGEIFKSATEICDVHLIPLREPLGKTPIQLPDPNKGSRIQPQVDSLMRNFWMNHSPTGDNSRERPYSNIYPRLTTKSNIFRVHTRAQVIKKARGSDPKTFDPELDSIAGEWRGSTLIERYIDPNNEDIPDYAATPILIGRKTLDQYYRFRILYRKRFDG